MTATKESPTLTRLAKIKRSPFYFIYDISTRLQSPELLSRHHVESGVSLWLSAGAMNRQLGNQSYVDIISSHDQPNEPILISPMAYGTTCGTNMLDGVFLANTTSLSNVSEETESDDFVFKPKYTSEFKIKVKSFRIDKSLPKIFID